MRKFVVSIGLAIFVGNIFVQKCSCQTVINWGENVQGVHLSIAVSNAVVDVGSATVQATIQNGSTNVLNLLEYLETTSFDIFLVNDSGGTFKLTPPKPLGGSRLATLLGPGGTRHWTISAGVGKELEPGGIHAKGNA